MNNITSGARAGRRVIGQIVLSLGLCVGIGWAVGFPLIQTDSRDALIPLRFRNYPRIAKVCSSISVESIFVGNKPSTVDEEPPIVNFVNLSGRQFKQRCAAIYGPQRLKVIAQRSIPGNDSRNVNFRKRFLKRSFQRFSDYRFHSRANDSSLGQARVVNAINDSRSDGFGVNRKAKIAEFYSEPRPLFANEDFNVLCGTLRVMFGRFSESRKIRVMLLHPFFTFAKYPPLQTTDYKEKASEYYEQGIIYFLYSLCPVLFLMCLGGSVTFDGRRLFSNRFGLVLSRVGNGLVCCGFLYLFLGTLFVGAGCFCD